MILPAKQTEREPEVSLKGSYTAASSLPVKLLQDTETIRNVRRGFLPPVHVQLNPTNRCNLDCSFCSCSERQKDQELEYDTLYRIMSQFADYGCKSVTITGGGEPLLHPDINKLIKALNRELDIRVGFVTNGTKFRKFTAYEDVVWCRISSSDDRYPDWTGIQEAVESAPKIDWAFSHVLTRKPNWGVISGVVNFANRYGFTHVRLVADLLDVEASARQMEEVKDFLKFHDISDSLVIYQGRTDYTRGRDRCLISLVKPLVGADGGIYPCCGVQYAQDPPGRDYVASMRMGWVTDVDSIWRGQKYYDGSACVRCYYDDYNEALSLMGMPLTHREFI